MSLTVRVTAADGATKDLTVAVPTVVMVLSTLATYYEVDNPPDAPVLPGTQVGAIQVLAGKTTLTPATWPYGVVAVDDARFKVVPGGWSGYALVTAGILPIGSPSLFSMTMTTDP